MKLRLPQAEPDDDEIDITPMLDCVFLLLLFFMLTSSFIEEVDVVKITLPKADHPSKVSRDWTVSVSIAADGKIFYQGKPLDHLDALLDKLKDRNARTKSRSVVLRCDARSEYQLYMQVKNVLKLAGVETIFEEVEVQP